jgi:hypothetical protein
VLAEVRVDPTEPLAVDALPYVGGGRRSTCAPEVVVIASLAWRPGRTARSGCTSRARAQHAVRLREVPVAREVRAREERASRIARRSSLPSRKASSASIRGASSASSSSMRVSGDRQRRAQAGGHEDRGRSGGPRTPRPLGAKSGAGLTGRGEGGGERTPGSSRESAVGGGFHFA